MNISRYDDLLVKSQLSYPSWIWCLR